MSRVLKRSTVVSGHKTSISLEDEFWERLKVIAGEQRRTLGDIITGIDQDRTGTNLSSAIRLFVLSDALARSVLPVATYSHMFATVDLLNLMKFLTLRCHPHAQHEIRVYAEAMRDLAKAVAPVSIGAWETHP